MKKPFLFSHRWAPLAVLLALACVAAPGVAQTDGGLDTVTVHSAGVGPLEQQLGTGSRLDLRARATPASVEVITRDQLRSRGDSALRDAITRSTGMTSLGHAGNSAGLSARGFTDTTAVLRLYDGTRQYGGVGVSFPFDTWSVERIEVLRGPASVVHGDGAIGGVVNVIAKKPSRAPVVNEIQARAGSAGQRALAFGSGGAIGAMGAIGTPWSYRLDLRAERSHGWVERGDMRNAAATGALRWDATPDLQLQLMHARGRQAPARYFGVPLIDGVQQRALRQRNYNVLDSDIRFHDHWTELAAQWALGDNAIARSKLYRITSQRHWRNAETYFFNAASRLIDRPDNTEIGHDQTQTGNTTDLVFTGMLLGRAHQLSLGFDIQRAALTLSSNGYQGSAAAVEPGRPDPGRYFSEQPFIARDRNQARQYALFAEQRLEITDCWSVVAAARFDHARLSRDALAAGTQAFTRSYAHSGWRLGTVYQLRPDLSLYAQLAQAAEPVSGLLMLSAANARFDVARGRQLEVGIKQSFWQGRGDATLAAYAIDKNNLLTRDPADPALRTQVGRRSSRGMEGTLAMQVRPTLQVEANVALLKARYDDFSEAAGGAVVSRNGNVPVDVPECVVNVWAGWKFQPAWTLSAGLRHVGRRYADSANRLTLPAYTTADLALQWQAGPDSTLTLRGFNVLDRYFFTTAYYTTTQWFVGEGRRCELVLEHRF
jgi:iron complex outermembrane receptor protein